MQHVEFFHQDHFARHYHRQTAPKEVSAFIEFFWETDFDALFAQHQAGFSDALFPNVGYTYLINLGTPYQMQLEEKRFEMKGDGFLPRHHYMICHHSVGNKIFGIKFRVSPVIFEKKINFSEYTRYIFPLSYLLDSALIDRIKAAAGFEQRVRLLCDYYSRIIRQNAGLFQPVEVVTSILQTCNDERRFNASIADLAKERGLGLRTLHRYFAASTGISCKRALQIMRIRSALADLTTTPRQFHFATYGYYDYSHFYKHLKGFVNKHSLEIIEPHLQLLRGR